MAGPAVRFGHDVLDSQHEDLFGRIAAIAERCRGGCNPVALSLELGVLVAEIETHFSVEESLLRQSGFPDWEEHVDAHRLLILDLKGQVAALGSDAGPHPLSTVQGFEDVLFSHELVTDSQYWPHLRTTSAPLLEWSDDLSVGLRDIDRQHQALVYQFHHLYALAEDDPDGPAFRQTLQGFGAATAHHFKDEERLFADCSDAAAVHHRQIHAALLDSFAGALTDLATGRITAIGLVRDFLVPWFADHVTTVDRHHLASLSRPPATPAAASH